MLTGVVSLVLFWAMIQMGVAVVVASLPTLRPLFHGVSVESVVRSIRSAVSLHSVRSKDSLEGNHKAGSLSSESVAAFADSAPVAGHRIRDRNEDTNVQTYVMSNFDHKRATSAEEPDGIRANEQIGHSVEIV